MFKKLSIAIVSLSLALTGLALAPANAALETPTVIGDLNTSPASSYPENLTPFDGKLFFTMYDSTFGYVLASWDPATSTKTIFTPAQSGARWPRNFYVFENVLYFYGDTTTGSAFFKYTGVGNPTKVRDSDYSTWFNNDEKPIFGWTGHGVYFYSPVSENEFRIFKYDGTNTPTLVNFPGYTTGHYTSSRQFALVGDWLYFASPNGETFSTALARTDGSTAQYAQPNLLNYQPFGLESFSSFKGKLYFSTRSGGLEGEVLQYDQNTDQITAISNFNSFQSASSARYFYVFGASGSERLYFTAFSPESDREIWRTNSDESGIEQVTNCGTEISTPNFTTLNSKLYFTCPNENWQNFLYSYSGTGDFNPAPIAENLQNSNSILTSLGSSLYFQGVSDQEDAELYAYNGIDTPAMVANLNASNSGSVLTSEGGDGLSIIFKNSLYYLGSTSNDAQSIFKYSGTGIPTVLALTGRTHIYLNGLVANDAYLFMDIWNSSTESAEIWRYDGATEPVLLTTEIEGGIDIFGDRLLGRSSGELFEISTANGGLTEIGTGFLDIWNLTIFKGAAYFVGDKHSIRSQLFKWTGSGEPELAITGVNEERMSGYVGNLTAAGDRLYFTADANFDSKVMSIDSSGNLVEHFGIQGLQPSYQNDFYLSDIISFNNNLYFTIQINGVNFEQGGVWKFDGTNLPTKLNFNDDAAWHMFNPAVIDKKLVFLAWANDSFNNTLWTLDAAGTLTKRAELFSLELSPWVNSLGDKLLFSYNDGIHGLELASLPLSTAVAKTKPGKISKLVVVKKQIKKTSVQLTWKAPVVTGGSAIRNYKVETSTDGKKWKVFKHSVSKKTNIVIKGLKSKKKYWARVSAINSIGTGISIKVNFKTK